MYQHLPHYPHNSQGMRIYPFLQNNNDYILWVSKLYNVIKKTHNIEKHRKQKQTKKTENRQKRQKSRKRQKYRERKKKQYAVKRVH